eukprot:SAG11_NODE_3145_length_2653_cov_1.712216_2_plen_308_part_01
MRCIAANTETQFAVSDGSVTLVVELTSFQTHNQTRRTHKVAAFGKKQIVSLLTAPRSSGVQHLPSMANWPLGFLPSFASGARLAIVAALDFDATAFEGFLTTKSGTLRLRTKAGDWQERAVMLRGDLLSVREFDKTRWTPALKLHGWISQSGGQSWITVNTNVVTLRDGRHEVALQASSAIEAREWERHLRAAVLGSGGRAAASLLRCMRRLLQVLVWAQGRATAKQVLDAVRSAFAELVGAKLRGGRHLYLAMHLLACAEHYLTHASGGADGLSLSKQWEALRKEAGKASAAWGKVAKGDYAKKDTW